MKDFLARIGNVYILKPVELENLSTTVKAINVFWQLVELTEVS